MFKHGEGVRDGLRLENLLKVLELDGMVHRECTCQQFHNLVAGIDQTKANLGGGTLSHSVSMLAALRIRLHKTVQLR